MSGFGMPGQTPGQQQMQQMQERMRQGYAWQQAQDRARGAVVPTDHLGFFARVLRSLLTLVFGLLFIAAVILAIAVLINGEPVGAGAVFVGALIAMWISRRISGWGRS
jgi:uncharacterized membrane protein